VSAAQARRRREAIDGVLLLDKPAGITSQSAVARVKALFNAAKAGHTGTLDPMATGLLPIALGEATKFSSALLDAPKAYLATVRLGTTTTTGDLEGAVTGTSEVEADRARIEAVLTRFRGDIVQTPPMYSALKHQGRPLYAYAREGTDIERTPRAVTISALEIEGWEAPDLRIAVKCSKGTYIRVLAEDIGGALGCGGCLAALRRTEVGRFGLGEAVSWDALASMTAVERQARLLGVDAMIAELPALRLDAHNASRVALGQAVECPAPADGLVRLYAPDGAFLGIGEAVSAGSLQPRRLVATKAPNG